MVLQKQQRIFRKAALERLSSPEKLDQLIRVTSPHSWVGLLSLLLLLLAFVLWGLFGTLNSRVEGQGILLGGSVYDLAPLSSGQVTRMAVAIGDEVVSGDVVAEVDQPALNQQIQDARSRLRELEAAHQALRSFGSQDIQLQTSVIAQQRANLEQSIQANETRLSYLVEQVAVEEGLVEQGLITRQQWRATQQSLEATRDQIERSRAELKQISSRELNVTFDQQQQLTLSEQRIRDAERLIAQLESDLALRSQIVSPYAGRVLELMAGEGDLVSPGVPVMKLGLAEEGTNDLRVILYVPTEDGKKIRAGMAIQIAPATVRPEEFGYIEGTVTHVADFPSTTQGMMHVLKNDQLVGQLSQAGAPFEVEAALTLDPAVFSGYRWTSSLGPPVRIHSGTPCTAWITVATQRPASLVIPGLKKVLKLF